MGTLRVSARRGLCRDRRGDSPDGAPWKIGHGRFGVANGSPRTNVLNAAVPRRTRHARSSQTGKSALPWPHVDGGVGNPDAVGVGCDADERLGALIRHNRPLLRHPGEGGICAASAQRFPLPWPNRVTTLGWYSRRSNGGGNDDHSFERSVAGARLPGLLFKKQGQ